MKKLTLLSMFLVFVFSSQIASARSWTCHATIFMEGTSKQWTPKSWRQSGGIFVDREKRCRQHIEKYFVNRNIFKKSPFYTPNKLIQKKYCKVGANFRVTYGFDRRKKAWTFRKHLKPICNCTPTGYK